ncbi:SNAP receptor [Malassezia nana]|uniref:SNAP receptor n=1 Tax=Malassezia nana TaxID=180528 RepID=A0AAF0EN04_9BASI|nr:SNAP receptor [Malassezia nana]
MLQSKLQRDFQDAIAAFQVIQKSGIRKEKVALAYAKQQGSESSGMDIQMQDQPNSTQQQVQTQIPTQKISQEELEFQESLIAEREAEIREIERGVQELNEIFRDLSHMVREQGGMIDNIEYNIGNLSTNVHGADRELLIAHDYQRRSGRRTVCLMMILALVVAVVLIVNCM